LSRSGTRLRSATIAFALLIASHALASGRVAESTILGDWCAGSKTAFHEVFSLTIEDNVRVFSSWLHERPAESGTWELNGRTLTIRGTSGTTMVYTIVSATKKRLVIREAKESAEVYVRKGCRAFEPPPPPEASDGLQRALFEPARD
jgi:hypothetical protein